MDPDQEVRHARDLERLHQSHGLEVVRLGQDGTNGHWAGAQLGKLPALALGIIDGLCDSRVSSRSPRILVASSLTSGEVSMTSSSRSGKTLLMFFWAILSNWLQCAVANPSTYSSPTK